MQSVKMQSDAMLVIKRYKMLSYKELQSVMLQSTIILRAVPLKMT